MADSRMKGRVKGLLGGAGADTAPRDEMYDAPAVYPPEPQDPDAQRQALQVLTLAQRTGDEHIATAQQQADRIRAEARASAEQIVREAQGHADGLRRDAEKALSDARAKAMQIDKDAKAKGAALEREAQQKYDDVVGTLETKRAALQEQIEALQQFDREYRVRLRTFMQGQLQVLDVDAPPPGADMRMVSQRPGP